MTAERENGAEKKAKKPFLSSRVYDASDLREAEKTAYDEQMDQAELDRQRKKDWLFLLIGVPLFIGLMYLIVLIFGRL